MSIAASNAGTLLGVVSAYGGICVPSITLAAPFAGPGTPAEKTLWERTSAGSSLYAGAKSWCIDEGEEGEEEEEEGEEEYLVEHCFVVLGAVPAEDSPPKKKEKKIEPEEEEHEEEEEAPP